MRMNRKAALAAGASLGIAFLAACSDAATAPRANVLVPKSSFAVGDATDPTAVNTLIKICKVGDASGTFTITDVGDGAASGNPTIIDDDAGTAGNQVTLTPGTDASPNCVVAVEDLGNATNDIGDFFTVTEATDAGVTVETHCFLAGAGEQACPAQFFINTAHGWTIVVTNTAPPPPPPGDQGCTPGYWKQDQHFDSWPAPITPSTTFTSIFGVGGSLTFLQALGLNGGGTNALYRAGAAAYLNALSGDVDYAYTTTEVIAIVNGTGAYAGLSVEARKDLLDAANNGVGGCPLN